MTGLSIAGQSMVEMIIREKLLKAYNKGYTGSQIEEILAPISSGFIINKELRAIADLTNRSYTGKQMDNLLAKL